MFRIDGPAAQFERDGEPHLVLSGAVHYPRVHPDHWRDRLRRVRAMGCNTVETYVHWNWHAPAPAVVDFTGPRDLGRFLDLAAEEDLDIIVRPGPYVCAEWEGGGLPGWLLTDPRLRLRCSDPGFLARVDAWFDSLVPVIAQRQYPDGGRVVMVAVENEYGSFGDDRAYLEHLRDGLLERGITVPLVTSDGPGAQWLLTGTVDGVAPTINFGSRAATYHDDFVTEYPGTPPMCMEFWNGWFDHWGEEHHVRDPEDAAAELATMLDRGMSVNLYMAHGGTNFGLWNGCNHAGVHQPTVPSYDYDSAIAENGALTPKFDRFREVFARHVPGGLPPVPDDLRAEPAALPAATLERTGGGTLTCDDLQGLAERSVDAIPGLRTQSEPSPYPPTFEDLGLERGMLLLRSEVAHPGGTVPLRLHGLRDRAHVFVDGVLIGIAERDEAVPQPLEITAERGTHRLDVLVESQGRINFGPLLGEHKGLLRGAWFGTRFVMGWRAYPLALDLIGADLAAVVAERSASATTHEGAAQRGPTEGGLTRDGLTFTQFRLGVPEDLVGADAFVDTRERGRGFLYVGPEMLGRYWRIGPQQTLYVPGPVLTAGPNIVTVLDTEGPDGPLRLAAGPILDQTPDQTPDETAGD